MSRGSIVGQMIGRYRVVENLGRGGMAEVYKAYQESLDRYVAIKVMHAFLADEEGFLNRFRREARAMASLNHPGIVGVYDFDVEDDTYYIVMELVGGGTLKQLLSELANRGERLSVQETVRIVLDIADALAYAHRHGMVHRDIKAANIMLNEQGRAVLTDFGIAKILSGPSFTATGAMIGTPAYMSPEQGLGQSGDHRSDIYALGVLFFQMATGQLPYEADTPLAVILKHVNEPIPQPLNLNSDLPAPLHSVILKAMAKNPDERYQTAEELASELRRVAGESASRLAGLAPRDLNRTQPAAPSSAVRTVLESAEPVGETAYSRPTPTVVPVPSPMTEIALPAAPTTEARSGRRWLPIVGIVLLLILIVGAGLVFVARNDEATPESTVPIAVIATTPSPNAAVTPTPRPTETETREPTADIGATAAAALAASRTAAPPPTLVPQPTPSQTDVPATADATATFLATCTADVEMVNYFTYQNPRSRGAQPSADFPMNWVLRNAGTCPLGGDLLWTFKEGEDFGQGGPVPLGTTLLPDEETTLAALFTAPASAGNYESIWQFETEAGQAVGPRLAFTLGIFVPATATPSATPTSEATPTPVASDPLSFSTSIQGCEYVDADWQCQLVIVPFGGIGPYTIFVNESEPPIEYQTTGAQIHVIRRVRCQAWVQNVKVQDSAGNSVDQDIFVSPNNYFPGGCTLP